VLREGPNGSFARYLRHHGGGPGQRPVGQEAWPGQDMNPGSRQQGAPKTPARIAPRRYHWRVQDDPIFADPSGRRRRTLRRLGVTAAALLGACLAAILVSMAGGPQAPFTRWADPASTAVPSYASHAARQHHLQHGTSPSGQQPGQAQPPGTTSPRGSSSPGTTPSSSSPAPSPSPSPTPDVSPTSPAPTNPAGHTPPGKSRPKPSRSATPHGP